MEGHESNAISGSRYTVTAEPSLNVREGAGTSNARVGSVMPGEIVEKLDENEDGSWYKIRSADGMVTGWCSAEYLQVYEEKKTGPVEPVEDTTTNPAKGVTRIEGERYGVRFYLTICNPADVRIEVVHEDGWPSAIGKKRGAKFAFNGDDWERGPRKVKGMEVSNGTTYQKRTHGEPSLIVTKGGGVFIDHKNVAGQWNVTSGLRYLIQNGKNLIPANGTALKYKERHARSVRGLHADGRVMFLTVDGQYVYKGMTLWEAAELMLEFGCEVAFDGGGGGDSVDVVDGVIVSVPDDEGPDGKPTERRVPQTILVFAKEID
ncbi:MAG: phosphodiester glycosidase family protein [Anaerolineales bacterium]|nr:phosphodiester glycosidase family protein [Anaerolineales bacterium]